MGKIALISDFVYGSIEISKFEKKVLTTRIFNRLHNILQTSTAYLTYPTLRTTRFAHSLGAMHLAGRVFSNGFANAKEVDKEIFLEKSRNEILIIIDEVIKTLPTLGANKDVIDQLSDFAFNWRFLDCDYLLKELPNGYIFLENKDYPYVYLALYQAIRIGTLIHDLGHSPFSHVVERFYGRLKTKTLGNTAVEKRIRHIFDNFNNYKAIHEQLGDLFSNALFDEIAPIPKTQRIEEWKNYLFFAIVCDLSKKIVQINIHDENSVFASLHKIITCDLDVDRMDYVSRDYFVSGLAGSPIRYDRLLASYTLTATPKIPLGFYPSVRALNTIENYFQARFNLYKHVLYHHRVAKTDALLEYSLSSIVEQFIKEDHVPTSKNDYFLDVKVENLWEVLDLKKETASSKAIIDRLSQWDDAWLLSLLRKQYFELIKKENQNQSLTHHEIILSKRLGELLSNRKNYYSLYKRMDSMLEFEEAIYKEIKDCAIWKDNPDINKSHILRDNHMIAKVIDILRNEDSKKIIMSKMDVIDIMVVEKKMNSGFSDKNKFYLIKDKELVELDKISSIRKELQESVKLMPQFYVFVLFDEEKAETQDLGLIRRKIGKRIGSYFFNQCNSK